MTIGEKLRELRGDKSQAVIAKAIDVSDSAMSAYENGDRVPRDEVKVRIAEYYGKTVQEIFFDNERHET